MPQDGRLPRWEDKYTKRVSKVGSKEAKQGDEESPQKESPTRPRP